MRFPQVPIGQRFTFQGRQYTKTGPLTASEEHTGRQRLLPRSAEVTLIDAAGQAVKETKQRYKRAELVRLLTNFKAELVESLREAAAEDGTLTLEQVVSLIESREI
jgi:hypothetical protein